MRTLDRAAAGILSEAARSATESVAVQDGALLAACGRYGAIWARTTRLFEGSGRQQDETRRARAHQALMREGDPVLARIAALPATTAAGHAARAAAVWAWDEGELVARVLRGGAIEDALLAALVADLICRGRIAP